MSLAPFDQSRIASYASRPDIARTWDGIQRVQGGELERLLIDAHLHDLLQITAMPANSAEVGERVREVANVLAKRRNRQPFDAIRAGLERLDRETMQFNPSNLSFWGWYLPLQAEQAKQRNAGIVDAIVAHAGARGAITDAELRKRLTRYRLSDAELDQVAHELAGSGIRVVGEVRSDVTRLIDAATAPNLVALLQPKAWQDGAEYSAYDAAITGRAPVTLADAERAIAFYDSRNDQRNKDAVVKVAAAAQSDQQLRDLVLAYHLERMTSEEHIPAEVARVFVNAGLNPAEATKLQGGGSGSSVQASGGAVAGSEREHKIYQEIAVLLQKGQLRAAEAEHDRVVAAAGQPRGDYAKDVALLLLEETGRLDDILADASKHLEQKNFTAAQASLHEAERIAVDTREVTKLRKRLEDGQHNASIELANREYYQPAHDALDNNDLAKAHALLEKAKVVGAPATFLRVTALNRYQTASGQADAALEQVLDGLKNQNFWSAYSGLQALEAANRFHPDLARFRGEVNELSRNDAAIKQALRDQGLSVSHTALHPQVILPEDASPLRHLGLLFVPAAIVDMLITGNLGDPVVPVLAVLLVWGVETLLIRQVLHRGPFAMLFSIIVTIALVVGMAFDRFFFTALAVAILFANGEVMQKNRELAGQAEAEKARFDLLEQQLRKDGLLGTTLRVAGQTFHPGEPGSPSLSGRDGRVVVRNAQGEEVTRMYLQRNPGKGD